MSKGKKSLVVVGAGKMYRGKRPAANSVWATSPELHAVEQKLGPRLSRFLSLAHRTSLSKAAMRLDPHLSPRAANKRGDRLMAECRKRLTEEDWDTLRGCFRGAVMETISGAMGATTKKAFLNAKTGELMETEPEPDWSSRLRGAELLSKIHRYHDPEGGQTINVTIQSYLKPGDTPWPGSGLTQEEIDRRAKGIYTINVSPTGDDEEDPHEKVFGEPPPGRSDD